MVHDYTYRRHHAVSQEHTLARPTTPEVVLHAAQCMRQGY